MSAFLANLLQLALTVAPWLVLGLLAAGVVHGCMSRQWLQRWLGGPGPAPVLRAAVAGAPLPLCSCGAIPTAVTLHRGGASRGATTALLVGTPGIGVDSVVLTWALLGPFMAVVRPVAAVASALATGLAVSLAPVPRGTAAPAAASCGDTGPTGCCDSDPAPTTASGSANERLATGLRYAFTDLLDDIGPWMAGGLAAGAVLVTVVPPESLAAWGSGFAAMVAMAFAGLPLYICATAATPVAAGLLLAGVSPGTVLVFLLAGPITSIATLAVYRKECGIVATAIYLVALVVATMSAGLTVDAAVAALGVDVVAQLSPVQTFIPAPVQWLALALLLVCTMPALRERCLGLTQRRIPRRA